MKTGIAYCKQCWSLLIGIIILGLMPASSAAQMGDVTVIEGFGHPESVTKDPATGTYYVSNIGAKAAPSAKDGDGYISQVGADGTIQTLRFLPQEGDPALNAPKGMAIVDGTLYVTDIDRVVGFDLDTREQVFSLDFAETGTTFLNDLTVFNDNTLFASATDIGTVFRVALGEEGSYTPVAEDIANVNGLRYDGDGTLYIVSFGGERGIWRLVVDANGAAEGTPELLQGDVGQLDGLALLSGNRLLISDWQSEGEGGTLRIYDLEDGSLEAVDLGRTIQGPADFYYDAETSQVWIPALPENRVVVIPLPQK